MSTSTRPVPVKALLFDTFGTVVDWRGSIIRDLSRWGAAQGIVADWAGLADRWRGMYQPQMERVRSGARPFVNLDTLHRESLEVLLPEFGLGALDEEQRRHVNKVWHRLDPWADSVEGLARLKRDYIIAPLSNGNVALLTNLARHAGLPWDAILSTEITKSYKPQPQAYLGACALLDLPPSAVMMCAAHNDDLRAARAQGLKTAFFARPAEHGPRQTSDLAASESWDVVAADIRDLADRMGARLR
jgi:2-haloacid dehalogenase